MISSSSPDRGGSGSGSELAPGRNGWRRSRALTEPQLVVIAALCWASAMAAPTWSAQGSILAVGGFGVAVAFAVRSPVVLLVGLTVASGSMGARAAAGHVPMAHGVVDGQATVVGDPRSRRPGWSVELRLDDGRRVEAVGFGRAADTIARSAMGDRVAMTGSARPVATESRRGRRHLVGVIAVDRLTALPRSGPLGALMATPQWLRERIESGADVLARDRRPLYTGLVMGDDRFQSPAQRLRFRQAGLTHLLAVSGQNVAFVLIVAGPILSRLPGRARLGATIGVLLLFAAVTRFEPSVLRATAVAVISAWAAFGGRPRSGVQVLSVAVVALILADPFLVWIVGFQLSVAASAGILLVGPVLARRVPGPRSVIAAVAVTVSAQLGVAPLLIARFGPVSVATVAANLLVGWAAAGVMMLGLTVGVVAGLTPPSMRWSAEVAMVPVELLLWWIDAVAVVHSRSGAPRVGMAGSAALVGAAVLWWLARGRWGIRVGAVVLAVSACVAGLPRPPTVPGSCGPGAQFLPRSESGPSVLVLTGRPTVSTAEGCLAVGIRSVDLVIAGRGDGRTGEMIAALGETMAIGTVRAPPLHRIVGAVRVTEPMMVATDWGRLTVIPAGEGRRLDIALETRRATGTSGY